MIDEVVKIFNGNCVPGDGCPIVVTAAGRIDDQLVGEYYAFVCDKASTLYEQSATITIPAAYVLKDDQQTAVDPSVIVSFLAHLAEEKLNSHLYEVKKNESVPSFHEQFYHLKGADAKYLLYLHLRGSYALQLHQIAKSTQFISLARLIGSLEGLQVARISETKGAESSA